MNMNLRQVYFYLLNNKQRIQQTTDPVWVKNASWCATPFQPIARYYVVRSPPPRQIPRTLCDDATALTQSGWSFASFPGRSIKKLFTNINTYKTMLTSYFYSSLFCSKQIVGLARETTALNLMVASAPYHHVQSAPITKERMGITRVGQ